MKSSEDLYNRVNIVNNTVLLTSNLKDSRSEVFSLHYTNGNCGEGCVFNLNMATTTQCIHISNHHVYTCMQFLFVNDTSIKLETKTKTTLVTAPRKLFR